MVYTPVCVITRLPLRGCWGPELLSVKPTILQVGIIVNANAKLPTEERSILSEAGKLVEQVSRFLDHSNLAVTTVYLRRLEGDRDTTWRQVAEAIGL
jgi:hypothetical protein